MCADVRNGGRPGLQFAFIRIFDRLFPGRQNIVQLLHCGIPALAVKAVESFFVVAAEFRGLLTLEFRQLLQVPEDQMIGKLPDGMISAAVPPARLFRRKPLQCRVCGHKPVFLVVSDSQLLEQDALECRLVLALRISGKREQQKYNGKDVFMPV